MAQEIITLENLAAEIAKLRGELATWKALAIKQDRLSTAQMLAVNSGATAGKIAQIATNTSDIAALQQIASSAFRVVKVAQLPASGEPYIMYLVPQTDGETLNYCNEYLWIDNAWELVGTTGAMANNGELQIIVNGVTVGTFTANQATNSTASITVPTDTSQLTNGAGYVDATALATVLASKQDSLSLTQLAAVNSGITSTDVAQIGANTTAIAGKQDALTTSQLAAVNSGITSADVTQIGTNTGNIATNSAAIISLQGSKQNALSAAQLLAVNSGITSSLVTQIGTNQSDITTLNTALGQSLTPSADDTYSLGGASFRYANVYAVTFTGDLTGTASKAIADEDGNSIKTSYGKLAGNQTWTGNNTYTGASAIRFNNASYVSGTPSGNIFYSTVQWGGYVNNTWSAPFTINNAIRTNGYNDTSFRTYSQTSNTLTGFVHETNADASDISFRPIVNGTHKLGSSSYQWSSVYAQSYYYNGTAWGLDQANTWGNTQTVTGNDKGWNIINPDIEKGVIPSANKSSFVWWADKNNNFLGRICSRVHTDGTTMLWLSSLNYYKNGALDPTGSSATTSLILGVDANAYKFIQANADFRPDANNISNLGTSTNQWKSVYSQTYYYNGVAWGLDKANEWTGSNKFKSANSNFGLQSTTAEAGSTTATSNWIYWQDKNGFQDAYISRDFWNDGGDTLRISISGKRSNGAPSTSGASVECGIRLDITANGSKSVRPFDNGGTDLGTSTNKWKTLNGINPGALSLPDASNAISMDTTNVSMDGTYTYLSVSVNGWLYILLKDTTGNTDGELTFYIGDSGTSSAYAKWAVNFGCSTDGYVRCFIPVLANSRIRVRVNPNGGSPTGLTMIIYPCLGNV